MRKTILTCAVLAALRCGSVHAAPSPVDRSLTWDAPSERVDGYYLYVDVAGQAPQRVDVGLPVGRSITFSALDPPVAMQGVRCVALAAYVARPDGARDESAQSGKVCGFFGLPAPSGLSFVAQD